ncbi:MAG TPA: hypothetical protein VK708_02620 [Bryobacteraceae bacterium]|nr:hypothetical protein [Bryobacteraceae bacterium]
MLHCGKCWKFAAALCCFVSLLRGATRNSPPRVTPAPAGPYHVIGNRILDATGHEYLAVGTVLPEATLDISQINGEGGQFGVYSPSSFITIRQRLNMNAVRLPVNVALYNERAEYRARVRAIVQRANQFELLTIIAADPGSHVSEELLNFWPLCASDFKNNPNVFFALATALKGADSAFDWRFWLFGGNNAHGWRFPGVQALVSAIRGAGAAQPIVVAGFEDGGLWSGLTPEFQLRDPNIIYEVTPRYQITHTDEDRRVQFGFLADRAPVLANDLDPQLDMNSAECHAFGSDPADATKLLEDNLDYFDTHHISWTLSAFRRGRMLSEYRMFNWSKLDDGWTCGVSPASSGIATVLLTHLRNADPHGLIAVSSPRGSMVIARGAVSNAYGQVLAEREIAAPNAGPLPFRLGNVSVQVTDSRGVTRPAALLATAFGWGQITFLVPANSATGPADVALVRSDGSSSHSKVIIADVAPGLWTVTQDGRGPVVGRVTQRFANGVSKTYPAWECAGEYDCHTIPIALSEQSVTTVRLEGTGFRYAGANAEIHVTLGDHSLRTLSFGALSNTGRDQVTVELPNELRGMGETDLFVTVNGALSNVARINCGSQ